MKILKRLLVVLLVLGIIGGAVYEDLRLRNTIEEQQTQIRELEGFLWETYDERSEQIQELQEYAEEVYELTNQRISGLIQNLEAGLYP